MRPATNKILYNNDYIFYNISTQINEDLAVKIKELLSLNISNHQIAKQLNISKFAVNNFIELNNKDFYELILDVDFKKCTICRQYKTKDNFSLKKDKRSDKSKNTIYNCYCKICQKEYSKIRDKNYRENNKEKIKENWKNYVKNNKDKVKKVMKKYISKKEEQDPSYKLRKILIFKILKNVKKNTEFDSMPYTIESLRLHLESLFEPWMNWDNWGKYDPKTWNDNDVTTWKWNIDHIIPKCNYKYSSTDDEEFKQCWALTNLRPYSAKLNVLEGNRKLGPKILKLRENNFTFRQIAKELKIDRCTIQAWYNINNIKPKPIVKENLTIKKCNKCKIIKPIKEFFLKIEVQTIYGLRKRYEHCLNCQRQIENERSKNYIKQRCKTDPQFKLNKILTSNFSKLKKNSSKKLFLNYTVQDLKEHLESLFEPWMNWNNWGKYNSKTWDDNDASTWTWNIDHIIPKSKFDYNSVNDKEFEECWSLSNLRPYSSKLNVIENSRKNESK